MSETPESVVRAYFANLAAGNARAAFALLASDVSYRLMGTTPISGESHGLSGFIEHTLKPFTSRLEGGAIQLVPDEFLPGGDAVVVLAHSIARGTTGLPYENEYAMVFRVRDGLITAVREYLDTALVETALFGRKLTGGE